MKTSVPQLSVHEMSPLFEDGQLAHVFDDGKTFPDCVPVGNPSDILKTYLAQKNNPGFNLKSFVHANFKLPDETAAVYHSEPGKSIGSHVRDLWNVLTRAPGQSLGSLIGLPHPYVVPGGRFREIYYWDSYFSMLGLQATGRADLILSMIRNFAFLIDTFGYIPNGNRTYFLGRSQPPFFSLMTGLLPEKEQMSFLPQLEKEYAFWMKGQDAASPSNFRVVRLPDGEVLNRYWDENDTPRPEAYVEDVELSHHSSQEPATLFRHIRAAAESGWDFSTRWFKDENEFSSIHTTELIPVDLNCLLLHLERTLAQLYKVAGDRTTASRYETLSENRKAAIVKYCWNHDAGFFFDYDFIGAVQSGAFTLAAAFPLFFQVASPAQAKAVGEVIRSKFLKPGGLTTTLIHSGQQWDAPNGWAPLQWITYQGLLNYGLHDLATEIKSRWTHTNEVVYAKTGKMTEKYDVWNASAEASGGEYPNQDGFGWTNGVYGVLSSKF